MHPCMRHVLAGAIATSVALAPGEARASIVKDFFDGLLLISVVTFAVVGTVSTLTAVSTVQNYRSSRRGDEPSAGWVGVGMVGGLAHVGLGSLGFVGSLPSSHPSQCWGPPRPDSTEPSPGPRPCMVQQPTSPTGLVISTMAVALGAASLGFAFRAATTEPRDAAAPAQPGAAVTSIGLPLLRFLRWVRWLLQREAPATRRIRARRLQ